MPATLSADASYLARVQAKNPLAVSRQQRHNQDHYLSAGAAHLDEDHGQEIGQWRALLNDQRP